MAVVASINALITANSEQFRRETKKAGDAVDQLKAKFGARSGLKDFFEILKGTGAVVGLTFALNSIRDMVQGLGELDRKITKAGGSWREWMHEIGRSVPVVKQTIEILDELTGIAADRRGMEQYAKDMTEAVTVLKDFQRAGEDARNTIETIISSSRRAKAIGSVFGVERETLQIAFEAEDQLKRVRGELENNRMAAEKLKTAWKGLFAASALVGAADLQANVIDLQQRILERRAAAATVAVNERRVQQLGDVIGGVIADNISDGIAAGLKDAADSREWMAGIRKITESMMAAAAGGVASGAKMEFAAKDKPNFQLAPLGDPFSGAQLLAIERARVQFDTGEKPKTEKEILDELKALNRKIKD